MTDLLVGLMWVNGWESSWLYDCMAEGQRKVV